MKYTGLFSVVQALGIFASLVRGKVAAMLLGAGGMGMVSLFNSTVLMLSSATSLGLSLSGVQRLSALHEKGDRAALDEGIRTVRTWSMIAAALGMLVSLAAAPLLDTASFSWGNHTMHFLLIAPTVAIMAITIGETAILKATRRLKTLAVAQALTVVASLLIVIPIYNYFGHSGIMPSILLITLASCLATISYSFRYFPYSASFRMSYVRGSVDMLRMGVAFVVAGVCATGMEYAIRAVINHNFGLDMTGFYNAGFTIAISYTSIVANSLDSDYFPRLSGVCNDRRAALRTVNNQVDVMTQMLTPLLVALMFALPVVVPLLLTSEFVGTIPMIQVTLFAMFFKVQIIALETLPLAKGLSRVYVVTEILSCAMTFTFIIGGLYLGGLVGTGIGLVSAYVIETVVVHAFLCHRFRIGLTPKTIMHALPQLAMLAAAYVAVNVQMGLAAYIATAITLVAASAALTYRRIIKERV